MNTSHPMASNRFFGSGGSSIPIIFQDTQKIFIKGMSLKYQPSNGLKKVFWERGLIDPNNLPSYPKDFSMAGLEPATYGLEVHRAAFAPHRNGYFKVRF
jgi:hypothetical protein